VTTQVPAIVVPAAVPAAVPTIAATFVVPAVNTHTPSPSRGNYALAAVYTAGSSTMSHLSSLTQSQQSLFPLQPNSPQQQEEDGIEADEELDSFSTVHQVSNNLTGGSILSVARSTQQGCLQQQLTGDALDSDNDVTLGDNVYKVDITDSFW
jgi:hypothetical protein